MQLPERIQQPRKRQGEVATFLLKFNFLYKLLGNRSVRISYGPTLFWVGVFSRLFLNPSPSPSYIYPMYCMERDTQLIIKTIVPYLASVDYYLYATQPRDRTAGRGCVTLATNNELKTTFIGLFYYLG